MCPRCIQHAICIIIMYLHNANDQNAFIIQKTSINTATYMHTYIDTLVHLIASLHVLAS